MAMNPSTIGTQINGMAAWNSGCGSGGTHKWESIISIAGTLYANLDCIGGTIGQRLYGQLLKSTTDGVTFLPSPPYGSPMWPSTVGPSGFVQYGRDYAGSGPDGSNVYLYAMASDTNGVINSTVARVPLNAVGAQQLSD
jgi:hypothetical protein